MFYLFLAIILTGFFAFAFLVVLTILATNKKWSDIFKGDGRDD